MAALALALVALPGVGISFDEPIRREYGRRLLSYYATLGADRSILGFVKADSYGGLFDLAGALLERLVGLRAPWYLPRHLLSALCGAVGVFYAARLAGLLGGARAALWGGLLLIATPRWFGHSLFNPKDIPFGAFYVASVFYLAAIAAELPRPRLGSWIAWTLATAAALSIRVGGLLLPAYLALLVGVMSGLALARRGRPGPELRRVAALAAAATLASLAAVGLAVALWPYLQQKTLTRLLAVLIESGRFPWNGEMLFAGRVLRAEEMGRSYLPVWLAITTPLAVVVGLGLSLPPVLARLRRSAGERRATAVLLLATGFPPVWAVARDVTLYNGIRHVLFLLPPLAALAALGWGEALAGGAPPGRPWRWFVLCGLGALLVSPVSWMVRGHPYIYAYFNPLAGGPAAASWRFDSDYWDLSSRAAAAALDRLAEELPEGELLYVQHFHPPHLPWSVASFLRPGTRVRPAEWGRTPTAGVALITSPARILRVLREQPKRVLWREEPHRGQMPYAIIVKR